MDYRIPLAAHILLGACVATYLVHNDTADRTLETPGSHNFHFVNLTGGGDDVSVSSTGSGGATAVSVANPSGGLHDTKVTLRGNDQFVKYVASGAKSDYKAESEETKLSHDNLIIALKQQDGSGVKNIIKAIPLKSLDNPQLELVVDGPFGGASSFDVYVTAPGGSLETAKPVGTYSEIGSVANYSFGPITQGRPYEVRLTRSGTKSVVADSGTSEGVNTGDYAVHGFVHEQNVEIHRGYTVNAYRY